MIAGLPWEAWLLLGLAVGLGLGIEVAFFRAHRSAPGDRRERPARSRPRDAEGAGPAE